MAPFPNRVNNGTYSFGDWDCQLPINFSVQNHAIHGLVYDKPFKVKKTSSSSRSAIVELEYEYSNESQGYPFDFKITIKYNLSNKGFECNTKITNKSDESIPVGDGWNPYFKLKGKADDWMLQLPSVEKIAVNKRMIPTGKKTKFDKFSKLTKIGKQVFDTVFFIKSKVATTELYSPEEDVTINVCQETGKDKYGYLQVFIPPLRKSIAIEPMICNTDAFNNGNGLISLKPKKTFSASYGIYLD